MHGVHGDTYRISLATSRQRMRVFDSLVVQVLFKLTYGVSLDPKTNRWTPYNTHRNDTVF